MEHKNVTFRSEISERASSAEWAVKGFAARLGAELTPETLFGVGHSVCYRLVKHDDRPVLHVLARGRLMNMFSALNVPVEIYDVLCARDLAPSDLDFVAQRPALFLANSCALNASHTGHGPYKHEETEYVWATRCNDNAPSAWPQVLVNRESNGESMMEGPRFANAIALSSLDMSSRGMTRYKFWIPSGRSIKWHPKTVLEHTLVRYICELGNRGTTDEPCGLAALEYLIETLADRKIQEDDLFSMVLSARNPYAYRDRLAGFFEETSEIVRDHCLKQVAVLYKRVARLWNLILGPARSAGIAGQVLNDIVAGEAEALDLLQRFFGGQA